jgi:uncharacterized protein (TIGR02145 family)
LTNTRGDRATGLQVFSSGVIFVLFLLMFFQSPASTPPLPPTITGPITACSGSTGNVYFTEGGMTNYNWQVSSGGLITSGSETSSITVTWNTAGPQWVSVEYNSTPPTTTLNVDVANPVPVSVSIVASANPVCAGTPVTFTATPVNGGSSPVYSWYLNGISVGSNTPVYSITPGDGDQIHCIVSSNHPCPAGNPATSNVITMGVNPNLNVSVSITASANPVCSGTTVTFTAVAVNGGSSPAYQWKVNGISAGTNSSSFAYIPVNGDHVTCTLTSNASCTLGNPALSNPVTMTVSPSQPVSVSIAASSNPSCLGSMVTFTATPSNGGPAPVYEWKVNGIPAGGNTQTYSYIPINGDAVTCVLHSNATCTTGNPATSNTIAMTVLNGGPVTVTVTASSNPVCQGVPVTFTAAVVNGGSSPSYQWSVNGFNVGPNAPVYTYTPANNDQVKCQVLSNLLCATGNPALSNTITMTVSANLPVSVSIVASANPLCSGTSVTYTATPTNGGATPSYQWKKNGINIGTNSPNLIITPVNGDVISCVLTSSLSCNTGNPATSNSILMAVSPNQAVSVSITASLNPACEGTVITFTATPVNGGTMPQYQWKVNGINAGASNPVYAYAPANGDVVTCVLTSNASCATGNPALSNAITMNIVLSLPVGISISASSNPSCQGQTVLYTATGINGGAGPAYQWMVNGINVGSNNPTYEQIPSNGDVISCILTSNLSCASGNPASSNLITMNVLPNLPVSITISASVNPVCHGTAVTFTAEPVNGGLSPGFQWKVNGINVGSNLPTFTYAPENGDVVICLLTSSVSCPSSMLVPSNGIVMSVYPSAPVGISIAASANPACQGTVITFTATPSNGGSAPVYQWKLNGVNTGANSPVLILTPANGDVVSCQLTSNAACVSNNPALSNQIIMAISTFLPVGVTIAASANPFCESATVTFTATPVNGGSTPVYQWKVNGIPAGTNNPVYTYNPAEGDFVTCLVTSNLSCATGNPATSNPVVMHVNTMFPAGVTVTPSSNPACIGSSVTFTAEPENGGTSPVFLWKVNGINAGSGLTYTYAPADGDVVTCQLTSNFTCVSGNPVTSAPVIMSMSNSLAPGVEIYTSTNPFCIGTPVTFVATPLNGGTAPVYNWKVNGVNAGTNSPTFIYTPANGDLVTCQLTSNATCINSNPAYSNSITMTASASLEAEVVIAASENPVCQGATVSFSATPVNGGLLPVYQWKVNGLNVGTNLSTYSYNPLDGDVVTCVMTSDLSCATGNPAISNAIVMSMTTPVPMSVTIAASANPVCQGTTVTYTATVVNGGSALSYLWRVNGLVSGGNLPTFSFIPSNGNAVTCQVTSGGSCIGNNPALSNQIIMTIQPNVPVSISISPSVNPFCSGSSVTFTALAANGGTSPVYQWKVNGVNVGWNIPVFTYDPVDGDVVTCTLTSGLLCVSNNPATSNPVVMTAMAALPVSITIVATLNPICAGTLVTYDATAVNGGSSPVYQWKVNGVNSGTNHSYFQYIPANGEVITCQVTSSLTCATSNPATSNEITMTVYPQAPVSITITASANPGCQGTLITFMAVGINGGTVPFYRWKVNGNTVGSNTTTYSYYPVNGDVVTCTLTSNMDCATGNPATSNQIVMSVIPYMPVGVTIAPSANPVCQNSNVTCTATPANGGSNPAYQWKVNGINSGPNTPVYTYPPVNGDIITCQLTSNASCVSGNPASSNTIQMTVSPAQPVSVTITASSNPSCQGNPVTYLAAGINGGPAPVYQWKVNGINAGTNSSSYTYAPSDGDIVTCTLTSNAACATGNPATSNPIIMSVSNSFPASLTIAASSNPACQSDPVTYTATPVNGGSNPTYQWVVNGINVGDNEPQLTYFPAQSDIIHCILYSSLLCASGNPATSNPVTMTVNPNSPVAISVIASSNPVCVGTNVTFTATFENGGTNPLFEWTVNGLPAGTNQPSYSYYPAEGDVVICQLTSNVVCPTNNPVTSSPITMTVLTVPDPSVSISASSNPACLGTNVTFLATPVNGGPSPIYQWKVNGLNAGTNNPSFTYIPANSDAIYCLLTSSAMCANTTPVSSNQIDMVTSTDLPVSISIIASANPVCQDQLVTFSATPVNGGVIPAFQWEVNGFSVGSNTPSFSYYPTNGDIITCELTSDLTCASGNPAISNAVTMNVLPMMPVSITISSSPNPICTGTSATFTAIPVNGGTSPAYQWFVNSVPAGTNSPEYTFFPDNGDTVTCQITSNALCTNSNVAMSNSIVMVLSNDLPASVSITASATNVCQGSIVNFTAVSVNGGSLPHFQWQVNGINAGTNSPSFIHTPENNDAVNCILTSNLICATGNPATSNTIMMVVNPLLNVSVSILPNPAGPVCEGTLVTFNATAVNGGPAPQYQWKVNGVNVGANSPVYGYVPVNGDFVSCILTSNAPCTTGNPATSNPVTMTVNPLQPVSISVLPSENPVCDGTTVSYTATTINGGSSPLFQWVKNGINVGSNTPVFTDIPANGDMISCIITSNAVCPTGNPATSIPLSMTVNPLLPVGISIVASQNPICEEMPVTFTATSVNGGSNPVFQWEVNGTIAGTNSATFTYFPTHGDHVTCTLTSNALCATGNPCVSGIVTMVVLPLLPVDVSIIPSANPVCAGETVTYTAFPVSGGVSPTFQWKVNGVDVGSNSHLFTHIPENGDVVTITLTSSEPCTTGNPATSPGVNMIVDPLLPVSVSVSPSGNPVCEGDPVLFTAIPVNGGSAPSYQWKVNGANTGTNSSTMNFIPANSDVITCTLTSNAFCAFQNPAVSPAVTMSVNPLLPVSLTISADASMVCAGEAVTFTASPVNGGTAPDFQWQVNGINAGTNSPTFVYLPADADLVSCIMTSSEACVAGNPASSNSVSLIVNPLIPVSIMITTPDNPICAGTLATYTAIPANGGTSPAYQWKVNGVNAGTNHPEFAFEPSDGDIVTCILTGNETCSTGNPAASNQVAMVVNPLLPAGVTISVSENPVCAGTQVTYMANPVNGGTSPSYQWLKNGIPAGPDASSFTDIPANGDVITCTMTGNASCTSGNPATSLPVTMIVNPLLPVSVAILPSSNPVCEGTTVTVTATATNPGTSPVYQWTVNGLPAGTNAGTLSYTPNAGDVVVCVLTSSETCSTGNPATSNPVTLSTNPGTPVGITISASANPICEGVPVTFTGTPVNGGTAPVYQWLVNSQNVGANSPTFTYIPENQDTVNCLLTSNVPCPGINPVPGIPIVMQVGDVPTISFVPCNDPVTTTLAKPFKLKGGSPNGGIYSGPGVDPSTGVFNPAIAGPGSPVITYTYTTVSLCQASDAHSIVVLAGTPFVCGQLLVDVRDNKSYPTLQIGTQCWINTNLDYGHVISGELSQRDNCQPEKYCYADQAGQCTTGGGLYQWDEIMHFDTLTGGQGFCPPGWHVPAAFEWKMLFDHFGGVAYAGDSLKTGGVSGFNALLSGVRLNNQTWTFIDFTGFFWSSSPSGAEKSRAHGLNVNNHGVSTYSSARTNAFSVRCLKD